MNGDLSFLPLLSPRVMSQCYVFTRQYLPEFKQFDITDREKCRELIAQLQEHKKLTPKAEGHTYWYDYAVTRIQNIFNFVHE